MNELLVEVLPMLDNGKFMGFLHKSDLLDKDADDFVKFEWCVQPNITVSEQLDYLSVLHIFASSHEEQIAVLNGDLYHGTITLVDCSLALANTLTATQTGGALLVSVDPRDYSLAHMSRLVESEGAKITGLWIEKINANGQFIIFIKMNTEHVSTIANVLDQNGYHVMYRSGLLNDESITERYNSLMKYLDI